MQHECHFTMHSVMHSGSLTSSRTAEPHFVGEFHTRRLSQQRVVCIRGSGVIAVSEQDFVMLKAGSRSIGFRCPTRTLICAVGRLTLPKQSWKGTTTAVLAIHSFLQKRSMGNLTRDDGPLLVQITTT